MKKLLLFTFILSLVLYFPNNDYSHFFDISSKFALITKLDENYVPQGISYLKNWIIISYYSNENNPSILVILDKNTGEFIKYLDIYFSNGKPYTGHAGGVTVSKKYVWISSDYHLFKIKLNDLINAKSGDKIKIINSNEIPVKGAFVQYHNNHIWVGEFYHFYDYITNPKHRLINRKGTEYNAWITGFSLDENENISSFEYILSIPDIVQDIEFIDNYIVLSRSYGRKNDSILEFYSNVLNEKPNKNINGIPLWFLDEPVKTINILPMSEGITKIDNSLYILFESAALKYINSGKYPTKYIWKLNLEKLVLK
jgi:hypothetical protein